MFGLELPVINTIITGASMLIAPAFDFIKKKFIKSEEDTPERTLSTLATTKPEVMPEYIKSLSEQIKAKIGWYNRDIVGDGSGVAKWVISLRAAIRPIAVAMSMAAIAGSCFCPEYVKIPEGIQPFMCSIIGEWMGERLIMK